MNRKGRPINRSKLTRAADLRPLAEELSTRCQRLVGRPPAPCGGELSFTLDGLGGTLTTCLRCGFRGPQLRRRAKPEEPPQPEA